MDISPSELRQIIREEIGVILANMADAAGKAAARAAAKAVEAPKPGMVRVNVGDSFHWISESLLQVGGTPDAG